MKVSRKISPLIVILIFVILIISKGYTEPYLVKKGDTLTGIANKFNVSIELLMEINPEILDSDKIYINQLFIIPEQPVKSINTTSNIFKNTDLLKELYSEYKGNDIGGEIHRGVSESGWVVTRNPDFGKDILFIHEHQNAYGHLENLKYYVKVESGGNWKIYDSIKYLGGVPSFSSTPIAVIKRPSRVKIGTCTCY